MDGVELAREISSRLKDVTYENYTKLAIGPTLC